VLAAMLSTGELFSAKIWQSTTAEIFAGFIGLLNEHVGKKITVIIDNASVHKAKATKYTWMSVKSRNSKTLEADVDEILDNFGSK
jgi:CTP:phosphocholine cytidylyltransferase-like protein